VVFGGCFLRLVGWLFVEVIEVCKLVELED